jgi:SAM-dependent methyltransferase
MTRQHEWGTAPDFVGPRHRFRETVLLGHFLAADPGRTVLNVGAGQGTFSNRLDRLGFEVTSTDLSAPAVEVLRRRVRGRVVSADATSLPFASESFAAVVMGEVLEHISRDDLAVREARRVLEPNGVLALTVPRNPAWFSASDEWAGHVRRYLRPQLVEAVERAGFAVVACAPWGFPFSSLYHRTAYEWSLRSGRGAEAAGRLGSLGLVILSLLLRVDGYCVGVERGALGYVLIARAERPAS